MAEYKKGFKKTKGNDDKFLTYVIVAFAAVILALLGGLAIYRIANPPLKYDDFPALTSFEQITEMPEDEYIVYFYGVNCSHCITIKEDVLDFAHENDAGIKVYLLESSVPQDENDIVDPITSAPMNGTPAMITVVDGNIVDLNSGWTLVLDLIEKINEGSYGLID